MLQCHAESHLTEGSCQLNFYGHNRYSLEEALGTCSRGGERRRDRIVPFRPDQTRRDGLLHPQLLFPVVLDAPFRQMVSPWFCGVGLGVVLGS